jgi:hypothetical protein
MKKINIIKTLSNLIQGSVKAKIATGIIGVVLVGGGVGGTFYYLNNKNNPPEYKIAGTEKEPNSKEVERTEEEKERDEKQVKLISLKKELKELDPNFKEEDNNELDLSNKELDELIGKYEASKKDLIAKKEEGSKKEEDSSTTSIASTGSTGNSSASTGGGSSNTTQGGNSNTSTGGGSSSTSTQEKTQTPQPPAETPDPPAQVDPVRLYDLENQLIKRLSQNVTNNPNFFSAESLAEADKYANLFMEDAISSSEAIASINGIKAYPHGKDDPYPLKFTNTVATKVTINGKPTSIGDYISTTIYMRCKIMYDANNDKSTLWVVSSDTW